MHARHETLLAGVRSRAIAASANETAEGARAFVRVRLNAYGIAIPCVGPDGYDMPYAVVDPFVDGAQDSLDIALDSGRPTETRFPPPRESLAGIDDAVPMTMAWEFRRVEHSTDWSPARLGHARLGFCTLPTLDADMDDNEHAAALADFPDRGRPLIAEILDVVNEECRPTTANWQANLEKRLDRLLFQPFEDGDLLTADHMNRLMVAIQAIKSGGGGDAPAGGAPAPQSFGGRVVSPEAGLYKNRK